MLNFAGFSLKDQKTPPVRLIFSRKGTWNAKKGKKQIGQNHEYRIY
jgi:hypothetical protein